MSSLKSPAWSPHGPSAIPTDALRRNLATGLRNASALLARLARQLSRPGKAVHRTDPQFEFYAEAGAPEGALFLDGEFVGWVRGVRRL